MITSRYALLVLSVIALGWTVPVSGTADGPDFYAVTGVASDDVLNLRAGPSVSSETIGQIPHDAHGLRSLGCVGLSSYGEWVKMTEVQRQTSRKQHWCKVEYRSVEGWVAARFLQEDSGEPVPSPTKPSDL